MAFENDYTLIGKLLCDPQEYYFPLKGRKGTAGATDKERLKPIVNARVYSHHYVSKTRTDVIRLWVKWEGKLAEQTTKVELKQGDHVFLQGHLALITTHNKGSLLSLIVRRWSLLWKPPNRFLRGHVLVDKTEYARFKKFSDEIGPFDMPATDPKPDR